MNLKEFNAENTPQVKYKEPAIGLNRKAGLFNMNKAAVDLIGLKPGDQLKVFQDKAEPENWYLEKVEGNGFKLREKPASSTGLLFNNVSIVRSIFSSVAYKGKGGRVKVAPEATEIDDRKLWGIITTQLKNQ